MNLNRENFTEKTYTDGEEFVYTVVRSFDYELLRYLTQKEQLLEQLFNFACNSRLQTFFSLANIKSIEESLVSNQTFMDFIFNATDKINLSLVYLEIDVAAVIERTVFALSCNRTQGKYVLLPEEITSGMYYSPSVLSSFLNDNIWILYLYIFLVHFQESKHFESIFEGNKK